MTYERQSTRHFFASLERMRVSSSVLCASVLVACSGGSGTLYGVGGTVEGLSGTVVLQLNGANDLSLSTNGVFSFGDVLTAGGAYTVTVQKQPGEQTCLVSSAAGTVSAADVTSLRVLCAFNVSAGSLEGPYRILLFGQSGQNDYTTALQSVDLDGAGSGSGTEFEHFITSNSPTATSDAQVSDGYTLSTQDGLTFDVTPADGIFSISSAKPLQGSVAGADANAFVASQTALGTTPFMAVGIKVSDTVTLASLAGSYTLISPIEFLSGTLYPYDVEVITATVSEAGQLTGSYSTQISFITEPLTGTVTGTFSISGSNSILLDCSFEGANDLAGLAGNISGLNTGGISADGDLLVLLNMQEWWTPPMTFGVRRGTGVTLATLSGRYTAVSYQAGANGMFLLYSLVLDGAGNLSGTETTVGGEPTSLSGTYTVMSDGTLNLSGVGGPGAVSADGNVFVLPSGFGVVVGVRQ